LITTLLWSYIVTELSFTFVNVGRCALVLVEDWIIMWERQMVVVNIELMTFLWHRVITPSRTLFRERLCLMDVQL